MSIFLIVPRFPNKFANRATLTLLPESLKAQTGLGRRMHHTMSIDTRLPYHGVACHQRLIVGGIGDGHTEMLMNQARSMHFGSNAKCVRQMCDAQGAGNAALEV